MTKSFCVFITFFIVLSAWAQDTFCEKLQKVNQLLTENHFAPKSINDSLSNHLYNDFLESIEAPQLLFTKKESNELQKHRYQLDDYILTNSCGFISDFERIFQKSLKRKLDFYTKMESEKFQYVETETLTFDKNPPDFYETEEGLYKIAKKRLKMDILVNITSLSTNKDSLFQHFTKLESETKKRIVEQEKCKLSYQLTGNSSFSNEISDLFIKTFVSCFDPHSAYFSNTEKNMFISGSSEDNSTFGINFMVSDDNEFYIAEIIPGSSAFENENIKENDKLIKIEDASTETWATCNNFNQVLELINSPKKSNLIFHFKKKDNSVYEANLHKKSVKAYENKCYSFIIDNEGENYGYIKIPSFYVDENGNNFLSNDLMFEILKLQKQQIKGLIIDLQDNGGGNVFEAVKVTGMFIDVGPVAQIVKRNEENSVLRDLNRGTNYFGPLVVVVNENSASASEFFANAIQDYGRGIIIGQKSFGKATMQNIFPLKENTTDTDFVKITMGKFYRITGKSHQGSGIKPDVEIPSIFTNQVKHEEDLPYALPNTEIEAVPRYTKWNTDYSTSIQNANKKWLSSAYCKDILDHQKTIDSIFDLQGKTVKLTFNDVYQFTNQYNVLYKDIQKIDNEVLLQNIQITNEDNQQLNFDSPLKSIYQTRIKKLTSDYAVYVATNILHDIKH